MTLLSRWPMISHETEWLPRSIIPSHILQIILAAKLCNSLVESTTCNLQFLPLVDIIFLSQYFEHIYHYRCCCCYLVNYSTRKPRGTIPIPPRTRKYLEQQPVRIRLIKIEFNNIWRVRLTAEEIGGKISARSTFTHGDLRPVHKSRGNVATLGAFFFEAGARAFATRVYCGMRSPRTCNSAIQREKQAIHGERGCVAGGEAHVEYPVQHVKARYARDAHGVAWCIGAYALAWRTL